MRVLSGTSGFSYNDWKGSFYPTDIEANAMLRFYASHLPTVEINNTFYRVPRWDVVRGWAAQVPDGFRFVLKASRGITHLRQLAGTQEILGWFFKAAAQLGDKLGPTLFQLPAVFRKDAARLDAFCASLPAGTRAAFEFRDESWFDDEIYDILRKHGAALCGGDAEEVPFAPPIVSTADFGYVRLRRDDYTDAEIADWCERVRSQAWTEAYVFFKHELSGPGLALALDAVSNGRPSELAKTRAAGPSVVAARADERKSAAKPKRTRRTKSG